VTCKEVADFLMDYLDGTLPEAQRRIFESHLGVCPDCRRYIDSYKRTIAIGHAAFADSAEPSDAPEGLIQSILRARSGENT
jgi:anti-sigma factor RsiW